MRAVVQDEYGDAADVLRLEDIDRPEIAAGEVLLRVRAAGIDRGVWHLMAGLPYPVRLAGYGIRAPKTKVRGREVAGTVEAVGAEVTTLQVGDEVFGMGEGCFAEYAHPRADKDGVDGKQPVWKTADVEVDRGQPRAEPGDGQGG